MKEPVYFTFAAFQAMVLSLLSQRCYGPIRKPKFFLAGRQEFENANQTSNYCVEEKPFAEEEHRLQKLNPESGNLNLGLFMFSQQEF